MNVRTLLVSLSLFLLSGCPGPRAGFEVDAGAVAGGRERDASTPPDGGAGDLDADAVDAERVDAPTLDEGGAGEVDSGAGDGGAVMGTDGATRDGGFDAGRGSAADAGAASVLDAGVDAGGAARCVSGARGTHAARFRWTGSGAGSTASVRYEANDLPDTARWRVTTGSRGAIGTHRPTFSDVFLGAGGLVLEGSTFMDVELSTAGLGAIANVTLALYGRSFNTTTSGSFTWMTFDGAGAAPRGLVSNSAPYEWYLADATASFRPSNPNVLLRIEAGPPSGSLVVHRVELCFDAR